MTTSLLCRLLVDLPASGPWNMAVDEMLLADAVETDTATLRFYQWNQPTLSLGYFQHYADRQSHSIGNEIDTVRRLSGGGAILHDREWTYSLALPRAHPLASETEALYQTVHKVLLKWLQRAADLAKEHWRLQLCQPTATKPNKPQPFLCFARRSSGDIVLDSGNRSDPAKDHKIVGSAQRRRRGAVLQHGSILLHVSDQAPELSGFSDTTAVQLSHAMFVDDLTQELAHVLQLNFEPFCLTVNQQNSAHSLANSKYSAAAWTQRR